MGDYFKRAVVWLVWLANVFAEWTGSKVLDTIVKERHKRGPQVWSNGEELTHLWQGLLQLL
jgi:hypothetical protein